MKKPLNQKIKKSLIIDGILFAALIVSIVLHNAVSALLDMEEPVFFIMAMLAIMALSVFVLYTTILLIIKFVRSFKGEE